MSSVRRIAYFSMEIAVDPDVPTYSGGLGMLAGDTVRTAADLHIPMVAVTLLARRGYFTQHLDSVGNQTEQSVDWRVGDLLHESGVSIELSLENRQVTVRAWQYDVKTLDGFTVPVYFLDTDVADNSEEHRQLTGQLYGGDDRYRLCQEAILGIGGIRMLRALSYTEIERFHLNEGHAALLGLELLREQRDQAGRVDIQPNDIQEVRKQCVFTTHTPVPAGHDRFDLTLVEEVLGHRDECGITDAICHAGQLNLTYLALALSHYVNGVAKKHGEVSQHMFADYEVDAITNGVHAATWVSPPMAALFDQYIRGWRRDNFSLRYALGIADNDLWQAHQQAKHALVDFVKVQTDVPLDPDVLTLGFGRRATSYKRPTLVLSDLERLRRISARVGRLQIVFAGKAHPRDEAGKSLIREVVSLGGQLGKDVPVVYLPNYDQRLGATMTAGVDVWLNTPEPPLEASGTSGMKAALNGVPSLSVLDGWWIEGCLEGLTGWPIGQRNHQIHGANAESLYQQLEEVVVPLFYTNREGFIQVMRHAIALNGSFFNTQRMLHEYLVKVYRIGPAWAQ
ncbi:MAG: alpha-glucan family phosphorylase [Pirellulaceae bacterium]|nr:alpha-glucan family phosphorylase [Pirellulaceae bacterium]